MFKIHLKPVNNSQFKIATIGNFDGLHIGHMNLLNQMNHIANYYPNSRKTLITFEKLPHEYFADKNKQERLTRISLLRDKIQIIKTSGLIDEVIILHFNSSIANLTPQQFIENILIKKLDVTAVMVGHDFKFGYKASGTIKDLQESGLITYEFDEFKDNQIRVSSSLIRSLALVNDLEQIKFLLKRNICYSARIIYGNQLGRKYNFPTINLSLGKNRPAIKGIFVAYVYIENIRYDAVASIGKNPTVSNTDTYKLEAHLLDIDLNLYGKIAMVEILYFLRSELKFNNLDSLFVQMRKDLVDTRSYFERFEG